MDLGIRRRLLRDLFWALAEVDPDDVPSVILSFSLGAFFLSEDRRALEAVYGTAST